MPTTRTRFEEELDALRHMLLSMGSQVDDMVGKSVRALIDQDVRLAEDVIASDDEADRMDIQIETQCMRLIALQQPATRDLRLIGTALKVITDLERIGDHAVDIAKVARKLSADSFYKPLVDIPFMAGRVRDILREALAAFVDHDLDKVQHAVEADDEVDDLYHQVRAELHSIMQVKPAQVIYASYLLFVAHYLERIADHAVNIAERVYYVETGTLAQLAKSHKTGT